MQLSNNTILITGGGSGIGLALAKRFLSAGSTVIACGRRADVLESVKKENPGLHVFTADVGTEAGRKLLFEKAVSSYPKINVLINNAGIQNRPPALTAPQNWESHKEELAINLEAPMHLSMLFIPHLLKMERPAILNVSSGLAFLPMAFMPTYCATKAALHSFTMSLREQLKATPIRVVEIVPPAVNTDLGGKGLHNFGEPLDAFADHAMKCLADGQQEFGYTFSEKARNASRAELDGMFANLNKPRT